MESGVIILLAIVLFYVMIAMIPASMAGKRGRSKFGWFLFSFIFSPVLGAFFVACLGETSRKREEKIREEEKLREQVREEMKFSFNPQKGKTINEAYK